MEDKVLVYVAGNPDAYPLEYYDREAECYAGLFPQLLSRFSAQSRYELVYYPTQGADRRSHLGKNLQVDLLSGYTQDDSLPSGTQAAAVLHASVQGEELSCYLCFTRAAPQGLQEELEAFFAAVPQEEISGLLLETPSPTGTPAGLYPALGALALAVLLLVGALLLIVRRYRKKLAKTVEYVESDLLTGLGNADHLHRHYKKLVSAKNRVLYCLIYFHVDTDRLHRLTSGDAADEVLRFCAQTLRGYAGELDVLAKVSKHGFVLLKLEENPAQTECWVTEALHKLRTYPQVYKKAFEVSVAACIYPLREGEALDEMVFQAGQEARAACDRQENCVIFSDATLKKLHLEQKLRATVEQALREHEFQLYIQFYVDAKSQQIVGGEALSRWLHPEQGLLLPGIFVPILEGEGMIHRLDYYCLESACAFLQELERRGVDHFFLSCNFSRDTFAQPDFALQCRTLIERYHFPRELLIFELTESVTVRQLSTIRSNMLALKEYGVSIALDDFGEGFTSFSDLQEYPVDGIKLDKRLIDNILTKPGSAIVRAMIQAGHELGVTILAEGVETEVQAQVLRDIHCDVIQGFRFHAPIPEAEAMDEILGHIQQGTAPL